MKRRQAAEIESLTKDNSELVRLLAIHQAVPKDVEHKMDADKENIAANEQKTVMMAIESEKERSIELTANTSMLQQRLAQIKGIARQCVDHNSITKYVNVLEKRLDRSIVRFNETINLNTSLRVEVDSLRREAKTNEDIQAKLVADIASVKRQADLVIQETSAAYSAKEKASGDMEHLKAIADREYAEFQKEWKELNLMLDKDRKNFESKRLTEITSYVRADVPECIADTPRSLDHVPAPLDPPLSAQQSIFAQYFDRIKATTGVESIEEFMSILHRREIENFSLFNRLNDLNNQTNLLSEKIELTTAQLSSDTPPKMRNGPVSTAPFVDPDLYNDSIKMISFRISRVHSGLELIGDILGIAKNFFALQQTDQSLVINSLLANIDSMVEKLLRKYMLVFRKPKQGSTPSLNRLHRRSFTDGSRRLGLSSLPSSIALTNSGNDAKDDRYTIEPIFRPPSNLLHIIQTSRTNNNSRPQTCSSTKASSSVGVSKRA